MEKIELFDKYMGLQTRIVVARYLLSKEPLGYLNGVGMENYIKFKAIEEIAEDKLIQLVKENPGTIMIMEEVVKSGRKFTSDQQKDVIEKITGRREDLDDLFERLG